MCLLRAVSQFKPPLSDLKLIYIQYIRSLLEQSCVVWHSSLTQENKDDIERVQKNSMRVILRQSYTTYKNALNILDLETLEERREKFSLKFALKCLKCSHTENLFEHKEKHHEMKLRHSEQFEVTHVKTQRYKNSAVPYMQKLLNKHYQQKEELESSKG